jgi:hypothetical protein
MRIIKELRYNDSQDQNISSNGQSCILFNLELIEIWTYQIRSTIKNNYQNLILCAIFKKNNQQLKF